MYDRTQQFLRQDGMAPKAPLKQYGVISFPVWALISWMAGKKMCIPMFGRNDKLPATARANSIKKGVAWFDNGRFFIHPSWKQDWLKYGSNGLTPVGPPVSQRKPNGDGSLGILEGHTSTIYYDGTQQYRYWMRADVQGEASMALAAAGSFLNNKTYKEKSANLIDYLFKTSNMRADAKNDPGSSAYGLIGWATTNAGTFYGDDNARAILGMIGAAGYLRTNKWDKELAEAIMGNFRTTGKHGFVENGWKKQTSLRTAGSITRTGISSFLHLILNPGCGPVIYGCTIKPIIHHC